MEEVGGNIEISRGAMRYFKGNERQTYASSGYIRVGSLGYSMGKLKSSRIGVGCLWES